MKGIRSFILSLLLIVPAALFAWTEVSDIPKLTDVMRCRVVEETDSVEGKEYEDNNVDRKFPMLQIIRKYDDKLDILIMFGLNGPNGMVGIRRVGYISNNDPENVSEFPAQLWWSEMYESVGPWHIRAIKNETGRSAQNFTGGFHAYIDRNTGIRYPSGENLGYTFKADGKEIAVGEEILCKEIECVSRERLGAYNTFDSEAGGGRMVLDCENHYRMEKDKILFLSKYKALEDIVIELHYGLQTVSHNPYMYFMSDEGVICYDTTVDYENEIVIKGTPHGICGERRDGRCFFARMSETGAFRGSRSNDIKFFARNYGSSNFKQYHYVYGNGYTVELKPGEGDFYEGYFCFTPEIDGSLFPNDSEIRITIGKGDRDFSEEVIFDVNNLNGYYYDNIYCLLRDEKGQQLTMLRSPLTYIPAGGSGRFRIDLKKDVQLMDSVHSVEFFRRNGDSLESIDIYADAGSVTPDTVTISCMKGYIHISSLSVKTNIKVVDTAGRTIIEKECDEEDEILDISGWPSSKVYILKITDDNSVLKIFKFVKL